MKQPIPISNQKKETRKNNTNHTISIFLIIACILLGTIIAMGCTTTIPGATNSTAVLRPDPETGLVSWISAVNEKNVVRLYELTPDFVRNNITEKDFAASNVGNPILEPEFTFTNYEVLNRTVQGDNANIRAVLLASNSSVKQFNSTTEIPIYYNFILVYENNEWKVWTIEF